MKILLSFLTILSFLSATQIVKLDKKYQKSNNCINCHQRIVNEWKSSWHSKSHYKKDEYFKASVDYVKRKSRKSLNAVKVQCATCHNPRISVTKTTLNDEISASLELNKDSKLDKAVNSSTISEGINCVVCHNIDKIHYNADESKRGMNRVKWMKSGTMTGPYSNAHSPYHKTKSRDFMNKNANKLCFVCHANDRSIKGLTFINMQDEYKKSKKMCVDCHMSPKVKNVASNLAVKNSKPKMRMVRRHGFVGAHTQKMWKNALKLKLIQKNNKINIIIKNPQPHNIPSGFASRELIVEIYFLNNTKIIKQKSISLTNKFTRRKGKATIAHAAQKMSKDMSIPAYGKKVLKINTIDGANSMKVEVYYRLVNEDVQKILNLKDAIWSKKTLITSKKIKLH